MDCPHDAVSLVPRRLESDVDVDFCPVCSGVWLQQGELEALQSAHTGGGARQELESVQASFEMARQELAPPGPCPACGEILLRREYGYTSQVLIDVCPRGHGLWLDAGELDAIERFFARQQAEAPEPTPLRALWAWVAAALRGEAPVE